MRGRGLSHSLPQEPFHQRHRGLLIVGALLAIIFVTTTIARPSNDAGGESDPGTTTTEDRAPYAEVACEGFTRDAGIRTDDGETSLITPNLATGDIYTVQMYEEGVRVGTCVVQVTGPEEWTLVKISGP